MIMTQEEKFEEAKRLYETANADQRYVLESLFPELAESEDERIRKALIRYFTLSDEHAYNEACGVSYRDIVAWLEKQWQNPAWSEKYIADVFEKVGLAKIVREQSNDNLTIALQSAMIELSKFTPQPKQKWSEEDKRKIDRIYSILRQASDTHAFSTSCRLIGDKECIELQDFLKYIRPQSQWKPSDEQMKALGAINLTGNISYAGQGQELINLYNDLKKLREE